MIRKHSPLQWLTVFTGSFALLLAGCGGQDPGQSTATSVSSVSSEAISPTASEGQPTDGAGGGASTSAVVETTADAGGATGTGNEGSKCANITGKVALQKHLSQVPKPFPDDRDPEENKWSLDSPTDTYDPCAELSWIVLKIDRGTASSPHQVMLFHRGIYAGRATDRAFAFEPVEVRLGEENDVFITFRYTLDGEPNSQSSGRVTARYSWNEDYQNLDRFGDVPPGAGWAPSYP